LAGLFRATVPERAMSSFAVFIERTRDRRVIREDVNGEAAARMFVGPLLTYAVLDGLFVAGGPPRKPTSGRIEEIVDMYVEAISP
jgi:TetR/AcrR family transcriptional regulator, mexJK operon transcriptional repressor